MQKGGSNWVDGENFFNRETALAALEERMRAGTHTLIAAQRRMGKTSLVRELLRRLAEKGDFEGVFVDLEAARDPADAIAEIGIWMRPADSVWNRIRNSFANTIGGIDVRLSVAELKVKLRAGIDAGNWRQRGDAILPPWRKAVGRSCSRSTNCRSS